MTEEQNTNQYIPVELSVKFEGALTGTPIQREEVPQKKTSIKRISPNRTISEAKKVGNKRISPKTNTLNRGQKRKNVNTSKSPNNSSINKNILTEEETILLEIPKKRLSFSTEQIGQDVFQQALVAEDIIKTRGLTKTVQSLPIPRFKVTQLPKQRPQSSKKLKSGSLSEPTIISNNQILQTSVVTSEGDVVTITTANITNNIQNTTITLDESQLQKGLQDGDMDQTTKKPLEKKTEDEDKPPTKKELNSMLVEFANKVMTEIQEESSKQDVKLDAVNTQV